MSPQFPLIGSGSGFIAMNGLFLKHVVRTRRSHEAYGHLQPRSPAMSLSLRTDTSRKACSWPFVPRKPSSLPRTAAGPAGGQRARIAAAASAITPARRPCGRRTWPERPDVPRCAGAGCTWRCARCGSAEPVLSLPGARSATVKSAMVVSSVSPERCDTKRP